MRFLASAPCLLLVLAIAGCGPRPLAKFESHIQAQAAPADSTASIPQVVRTVPLPPPPEAREAEIKYSVVVANQPVREVLLAMARETRVNFDIHPGIEGTVNLNAIDQTLKQILNRMAKQVDMRWETDGQTITVMPDTPYLHVYKVDYVNMSRDVSGTLGVQSQVVAPPGSTGTASPTSAQNSSLLKLDYLAKNHFWETLERNVKEMLRETDKLLPEGSSETFVQNKGQSAVASTQARTTTQPRTGRTTTTQNRTAVESPGETQQAQNTDFVEQRLTFREAASVIVNAETGTVLVRGTSRQHEKVAEFIAQVAGSARRQVLIEATIVEVLLSDSYQTGVDWSALGLNGLGYSFSQNLIGSTNLAQAPFFSVTYNNPRAAAGGNISSTVKLLDLFGKTRVLSSPKLMVLNNQTALLKVVDNLVYFSVQAQITPATVAGAQPIIAFTTTQNVVPVGFVMNVTPQIGENDIVVLNVRPTVSRILDFVNDPNPNLATAGVINKVPEIQSREFESVLRVASGQTAILGGLMVDSFVGSRAGVPLVSRIPVLGDLASYRNDVASKTELVIFIRPMVIRDASLEGDLSAYRRFLPDADFFKDTRSPFPCLENGMQRLEDKGLASGFPCKAGDEPKPDAKAEPARSSAQ
jgi:MSHA biogenesis protein MshL